MSDHHDCTVCPCPRPRGTHCPCLHRKRFLDAVAAGDGGQVLAEPAASEHQTWVRPLRPPVPGDVVAAVELHLEIDAAGRAYVHEAVLAQLFREAGWERTA